MPLQEHLILYPSHPLASFQTLAVDHGLVMDQSHPIVEQTPRPSFQSLTILAYHSNVLTYQSVHQWQRSVTVVIRNLRTVRRTHQVRGLQANQQDHLDWRA